MANLRNSFIEQTNPITHLLMLLWVIVMVVLVIICPEQLSLPSEGHVFKLSASIKESTMVVLDENTGKEL